MKKKLSKKKLNKMITSDFTDLSTEEIKALIQKEVDKGSDALDTDYIDLCFELLSIKNNDTNKRKIKFTKAAKVLLAAAVLMVIFSSTITVSAQFNLNIPQKIAQLINGNAEIDMTFEFANTKADIYNLSNSELALDFSEHNISPVTFPKEMITENCSITNIDYSSDGNTVSTDAIVHFKYKNIYGNMMIRQFNEDYKFNGNQSVMGVISGQMISANGMDILVFERDNSCSIVYRDNVTEYNIYLESDIKTTIEFAKSIQ